MGFIYAPEMFITCGERHQGLHCFMCAFMIEIKVFNFVLLQLFALN